MNPHASLQGQVAIVTGGCGGIGEAIVRTLTDRGATCVSLDVVAPARPEVQWQQTDVRSELSVRSAIDTLAEERGRIDLVVHAAGISRDAVIWKLGSEAWDEVQAVNLRSAYLLMHHVIPVMRQKGGGSIVLMGSINGSRGKFGLSAYAASKAGLLGLSRSVARETGRLGIRVNVVEPGMVRSPMTDSLPEEVLQAAVDESLLGRLAEPEDIAHAVAFLCSNESRHITGQVLRVDGGQYL